MIENKNVLVILSLIVVASGCAHTASTNSNEATSDSVSINNFSAFPNDDVYNNQNVRLTLTLKNDGEATAENVKARLFNVPFGSGDSEWSGIDSRTVSFGSLEPEDEEANLPARESTEFWSLEAPSLDNGVTIPYQFMTEVFYNYETQGTTSITLMDQQRFREEGNAQRPTLDTTSGPIQMEVRTRSPIVFYPGDGSNRQSEMCVIVTNEGQGTPFWSSNSEEGNYQDLSEEELNTVRLQVEDQSRISFENPEDGSNTVVVDIFGNRGIGCFDISVDGWSDGVGPQEEVPIIMTADYGYSKETSTSVTVTGSDRFGTSSSTSSDSGDTSTTDDDSDSEPDIGSPSSPGS